MDSGPHKPTHPSYRAHRRQVVWQIILPVVLAGLLLIGAIYLLSLGAFRSATSVTRMAAISTMWLTIPVMIGGLVMLALLIGVAYLVGRVAGLIPRYSHPVQKFTARVAEGAHRVEQLGHRPLMIIPQIGRLARTAVHRIRRG